MLIVGFEQLRDFYPQLIADNLSRQGIAAQALTLALPSLGRRRFNNPVTLAQMLEDTVFRSELVAKLKPHLKDVERVGFPAVLGLQRAAEVQEALQNRLRRPVFEIPGLTPSVPGMRLHQILLAAIKKHGGQVFDGMEALGATSDGKRVMTVHTASASRRRPHRFRRFLLATGGILGGGIETDHTGSVQEMVFGLPVSSPGGRQSWFRQAFMDPEGHPIYRAGLEVNGAFQPVNGDGAPVYENLYAAGTTLAHCDVIRERSFEGVAIATGYAAVQ